MNTRGWLEVEEEMRNERYPKHDPAFEEGKKIYQGRGRYVKYAYCLPSKNSGGSKASNEQFEEGTIDKDILEGVDNKNTAMQPPVDFIELNRENLEPYRKLAVGKFANLLYDCKDPGRKVLAKLEKEEAGLVVYYLNREYQLRLRQPQGPGKQAKRF